MNSSSMEPAVVIDPSSWLYSSTDFDPATPDESATKEAAQQAEQCQQGDQNDGGNDPGGGILDHDSA